MSSKPTPEQLAEWADWLEESAHFNCADIAAYLRASVPIEVARRALDSMPPYDVTRIWTEEIKTFDAYRAEKGTK